MLSHSETIIYLKRTDLEIVKVETGLVKKILMRAAVPWNEKNINAIIKAIPETFRTKSIRVLIDTDICYSLVIPWEKTINPTRKEIQDLAQEKIPELLANEWWDYKLLLTNHGKKILIFAPVQDIYRKFIQAIKTAKLNNQGSYPLELLPRTKDDFITFAQINLHGNDEETLALKPEKETLVDSTLKTSKTKLKEEILPQPKSQKLYFKILLLILFSLLITLVVMLLTKKSTT